MKVVWKYNLVAGAINTLALPANSQILCVKIQKDDFCMWVLTDGKSQTINRRFIVVGTGHPFDAPIKEYLGTTLSPDHTFVFHAFEVF
jgi:hypothetical protein